MSFTKLLRPALLSVLAVAVAPGTAHAGDVDFGLRIGGRRGAVSLSVGSGGWQASYGSRYGARPSSGCDLHRVCLPRRVWIPGHYDTVERRVWVPGRDDRVWIEPVYETRCDAYGRTYEVLVRAGYWKTLHSPGHYETVRDRTWVPGYYETKCEPYDGYRRGGYGRYRR